MSPRPYQRVVNFLAEQAPSVEDKPGEVIRWAEPMCDLLVFIYNKDYDEVTEDLYEAVKEYQDFEN